MQTNLPTLPPLKFHAQAYIFLSEALRYTQDFLQRTSEDDEEGAHLTGPELLDGIRRLALKQWGMMTPSVFAHWGIHCTLDFGRLVFELIERGEMRKTDSDQLSDFANVYNFEDAFCREYHVDTSKAYRL